MRLEEYANKYANISMTREDGVLEVVFGTDGGPLRWTHIGGAHSEFAAAFSDIAHDADNRVVIMTGTGEAYSLSAEDEPPFAADPATWDTILRNGTRIVESLLSIDALVIGAINGPAHRHPEVPLLADIVLADEHATVHDAAHIVNGVAPLDGMNAVMPLLMGLNRGRRFLLTGETLDARQLLRLGLVSEVLPRERLLPRARELAAGLARQNPRVSRYTRRLFMSALRRSTHELLGHGLALEGLGFVDARSSLPR